MFFSGWMGKLWYIQTLEYYLGLEKKKKELSSYEKIWRNLKCILQSERSQSQKATYWMNPTMWHSGKQNYEDKKEIEGCHGLLWVEGGMAWIGEHKDVLW